ncbi:hypothetical protein O6H91_19G012000 [Diphasiastrum complanatum]|uniref:Uncharacterized protein n=2 Tax=Diphasiastrum complanatum TaxID=34168 RepID=A0ACC2ASR7_DIPCM|nr:hypothetical protein O6H91_19G012000 [Diphasiastrum complanatum]KAJ7520588.1 hypothetical protein O6H91_19G012000 [Diphasiastrum complanatum]
MATGVSPLNAELPKVSSSSEPKEAQEFKVDHNGYASELPDHATREKNGNAPRNLAASEPPDNTANPASDRSSPESCSLNSLVTTEADINGEGLQPASRKFKDGVEQSDDSSVCSNFLEEEEETSDKILSQQPSTPSNLVDRSEEESQLCEGNAEIRDIIDDSLCQKSDKDYEDSNTRQADNIPSNSATRSLKDYGDVYTGETGRSGGEGDRRGETRFAAGQGPPQDGSQLFHGTRNFFEADSGNVLFRPTDIVVKMIEFQVRVIMIMFSTWVLTVKYAFKVITNPIQTILQAKDKVAEAFHFVLEEIAWLWSLLRKLASKCSYGVLVGTYITLVLGFLLLPAVVLDFLLMSRFVEEPIQVREMVLFDYSLLHPSAVVSLFPSEQMSKDHIVVGDPNEILSRRVTAAAYHKFDVTLTLTMPDSDHNIQLGMFQVSAELLSPRGQSLAKFYQPCMLRFHSNFVRYIRSMLMAIPTFLGLCAETQTHVLRLIDTYGDVKNPVGSVKISLEPRAGFMVGAGLPEIYSAEVLVQSGLPGVKSIIYKFKLLIFLWIGSALFSIEVAFVLCCCRRIFFPKVLFGTNTNQIAGGTIPNAQPKSLRITADGVK